MPATNKLFNNRVTLVILTLVVALPVAALIALQFVGLSLGFDLDPPHQVLLSISALSLIAAIGASLLGKSPWIIFMLLLAAISLAGSFIWAPIAQERQKASVIESAIARNKDALESALSVAPCKNGQQALLSREQILLDGESLSRLSLQIMQQNMGTVARVLVISTTGKTPPNVNSLMDFVDSHGNEWCRNAQYEGLLQMYQPLITHYRQQRPRIYPRDPLYAKPLKADSDGFLPIDPYELLLKIRRENRLIQNRFRRMQRYAVHQSEQRFDNRGRPRQHYVQVLQGDASRILIRREWQDAAKGIVYEELVGNETITYREQEVRHSKPGNEHAADPHLFNRLHTDGARQAAIRHWDQAVIHQARAARQYTYATWRMRNRDVLRNDFHFIIDDETGVVLSLQESTNGVVTRILQRQFRELDWPGVMEEMQRIKSGYSLNANGAVSVEKVLQD